MDFIKATGSVKYELFDEAGKLLELHEYKNLVVTVGKTALAAWLAAASQSGPFMPYIALGTSSTPATSGDTALGAELSGGGYSRVLGSLTSSSNVFQNVASFGPGNGTGALTEAGLFSASTSGTMFAHQVFGTISKAAGNTLQITWQVTFS